MAYADRADFALSDQPYRLRVRTALLRTAVAVDVTTVADQERDFVRKVIQGLSANTLLEIGFALAAASQGTTLTDDTAVQALVDASWPKLWRAFGDLPAPTQPAP